LTPEQERQAWEIFDRAVELGPNEREAFLRQATADPEVLAEVLRSVGEHDRLAGFAISPDADKALAAIGCPLDGQEADSGDERLGTVLKQKYRLDATIDHGGTSTVYRAADLGLPGKRWTVKVLDEFRADRARLRRRFDQEIAVLTSLDGRNGIVTVVDAGELPDGTPFYVMPYVSGATLADEIAGRGPLDFPRVARIVAQIAKALDYAHGTRVVETAAGPQAIRGIWHLDLKPKNIVVHQEIDGEARISLIDFGTAKILSPDAESRAERTDVMGTVVYMAPEHLQGRPCASSDIYSLGITTFEALTGLRPTPLEINALEALRSDRRAPGVVHPLPRATQAVLARAIAFNPPDRYKDTSTFADELEDSFRWRPKWRLALKQAFGSWQATVAGARPASWIVISGLLLILALAGITALHESSTLAATFLRASALTPVKPQGDTVDELLTAYRTGVSKMRANLALQAAFVGIGLLAFTRRWAGIRVPAFGLTIPVTSLYFIVPVMLGYYWLDFGYGLDDLIKWRAAAWHQLAAVGATARASEFNDGGYMDGWFMWFRPWEHPINADFVVLNGVLFCLFYCSLFAANHALTVALLVLASRYLIAWIERPSGFETALVWSLPALGAFVILASHLEFRFGGHNPNWMQPIEVIEAAVLFYVLYRRSVSQSLRIPGRQSD
jgi:hypothetical protein